MHITTCFGGILIVNRCCFDTKTQAVCILICVLYMYKQAETLSISNSKTLM